MRKALIPLILLIVAMLAMPVFAVAGRQGDTGSVFFGHEICPTQHGDVRIWMPSWAWDRGCKFWCS